MVKGGDVDNASEEKVHGASSIPGLAHIFFSMRAKRSVGQNDMYPPRIDSPLFSRWNMRDYSSSVARSSFALDPPGYHNC